MTELAERLKAATGATWSAYIHHPWIDDMVAGKLSAERLRFFLLQDLPYLADYERIYHLAFAKLSIEQHRAFRPFIQMIAGFDEGQTEIEMLRLLGANEFPSDHWAALPAREAYKNHLIRIAHEGTAIQTLTAMLPCSIGFTEIGNRLRGIDIDHYHEASRAWIECYRRPFQGEHVDALLAGLEPAVAELPEKEIVELERIFLRSTQHQIHVFDAAWRMKDEWPGPGSWQG